MPKAKKQSKPGNRAVAESAASATAERLTITLFEADTAALKRLRNGLFADTEEIATASEIVRFLLRSAPKTLDGARFLAAREEMQQEDGRTKRAGAAAEK